MNTLDKKIVFTNGCFDLLHQGHIDLLFKASKYGDKLIVGLNSDDSVKLLKGESRPVENQNKRRNKLLQLNYIDDVHIFNEETPLNLIHLIRPDILVKGGDYNINDIVGAKDVVKWGGRVIVIPLTPGYSTTLSIKNQNK
ncbi:MAG: D-glycero-beta-D-manno-heptose 1-phosphate adenylyltransferase [Candidatus Marinimicrobia bacterium]|nr:D-glycero-beta-D-manno-heptose 1-phosphate adenylyltransferase [Candidatus Neomarinimicrobiota bacterium]